MEDTKMKTTRTPKDAKPKPTRKQGPRAGSNIAVGRKNWIKIKFDARTREGIEAIARSTAGTLSNYARICVHRDYLERSSAEWGGGAPALHIAPRQHELKALQCFQRHHLRGRNLQETVEWVLRVAMMHPKPFGQLLDAFNKYCAAEGLDDEYNRVCYARDVISSRGEYADDNQVTLSEED